MKIQSESKTFEIMPVTSEKPLQQYSARIYTYNWESQPIQQTYYIYDTQRIELSHGFESGTIVPAGTRLKLQVREVGALTYTTVKTVLLSMSNNYRLTHVIDPADYPGWEGIVYKVVFDPTDPEQPSGVREWSSQEMVNYIYVESTEPGDTLMEVYEQYIDGETLSPKDQQTVREGETLRTTWRPKSVDTGTVIYNIAVAVYVRKGSENWQFIKEVFTSAANMGRITYDFNADEWNAKEGETWYVRARFEGNDDYNPSESVVRMDIQEPIPEDEAHPTRIDVSNLPEVLRELERIDVACKLFDEWDKKYVDQAPINIEVYWVKDDPAVFDELGEFLVWEGTSNTQALQDFKAWFYISPDDFTEPPPVYGNFYIIFRFAGATVGFGAETTTLAPSVSDKVPFEIEGRYEPFQLVEDRYYPGHEEYYGDAEKVTLQWRSYFGVIGDYPSMRRLMEDEYRDQDWELLRIKAEKRSLLNSFGHSVVEQYKVEAYVYAAGSPPIAVVVAGVIAVLVAAGIISWLILSKIDHIIWGERPPEMEQYCKDLVKVCGPENVGEIFKYTCPDGTVIDACECALTPEGEYKWIEIGQCPQKAQWQGVVLLLGGAAIAAGAGIYILSELMKNSE
ncbi:MAG: hypothetical protein PHI12_11245 [Dehalococcoidales bacterium]|nr:hypothetical protein [Dehalococcoidales bacterium]